jgi:hypothetical protein
VAAGDAPAGALDDRVVRDVDRGVALELAADERELREEHVDVAVAVGHVEVGEQLGAEDLARDEGQDAEDVATLCPDAPEARASPRPGLEAGSPDGEQVDLALLERGDDVVAARELEQVVVGEDPRVPRPGELDGAQVVRAAADVAPVTDDAEVGKPLGPPCADLGGRVGRRVVEHGHLDPRERAGVQRGERAVELLGAVERDEQDLEVHQPGQTSQGPALASAR